MIQNAKFLRVPCRKISSTTLFIDTTTYSKQELKFLQLWYFSYGLDKHKIVLKRYECITCFSRLNYGESIIPSQHQGNIYMTRFSSSVLQNQFILRNGVVILQAVSDTSQQYTVIHTPSHWPCNILKN